ncbi:MAG: hypothetical protein KAG18_01820 [Sinobacterium sp.]|nr:hypothetical protein [Sinobacterium sp.]
MKKTTPEKLLKKHQQLNHTDTLKISSHVQREKSDWVLHTLMVDGVDAPFKFKRKEKYKSLKGQRVNMTYYRDVDIVAGMEMEVMKVVRIKIS